MWQTCNFVHSNEVTSLPKHSPRPHKPAQVSAKPCWHTAHTNWTGTSCFHFFVDLSEVQWSSMLEIGMKVLGATRTSPYSHSDNIKLPSTVTLYSKIMTFAFIEIISFQLPVSCQLYNPVHCLPLESSQLPRAYQKPS